MNETTILIIFVAVTSVAVVLQAIIMLGMFITMRKTMARTQALQEQLNQQALPAVKKVRTLVDESTPKLESAVSHVTESAELLRAQVGKIDDAVSEIVELVRARAAEAGDLASRTMGRVDQTAAAVQATVNLPLRRFAGLVEGLVAAINHLATAKTARRQSGTEGAQRAPSEDMFI